MRGAMIAALGGIRAQWGSSANAKSVFQEAQRETKLVRMWSWGQLNACRAKPGKVTTIAMQARPATRVL